MRQRFLLPAVAALAVVVSAGIGNTGRAADANTVTAHNASGAPHMGMGQGGMMGYGGTGAMGPNAGPGAMRGTIGSGPMYRGMGPGMMYQGMGPAMMYGGMGPGMMYGGMGPGMMYGGMGPGMMYGGMGSGMMYGPGGEQSRMGLLFGGRVVPPLNLSVEDVRGYLDLRLEQLGNKRLKLGAVKADGDTIVADIVTVDNSLVQRLKIDRHTGVIDYGS